MSVRALRLLHVDDDEDDRFFFQRAVASAGLPIVLSSARSAGEALNLLRSSELSPDLVLLDIRMPEVSGLELLEQLRSGPHADLRIVIYSSSDHDTDVIRARDLGANGYFAKRGGVDEMRTFVRDLYDRWAAGKAIDEWPGLERREAS